MVLEKLEPRSVWNLFENLMAATPRPSKKEAKIRSAIVEWTLSQSRRMGVRVQTREDSAGNILITIPATDEMKKCPPILLQAHLDMVCETNRPGGYDFDSLPIPLKLIDDGDWVGADGTTLGSDNGIGVSLALALLADYGRGPSHGPVEILLTVDEETGLTGAFGMDLDKLGIQSRLLINLDTETTGTITIGSAGGGDITLEKHLEPQKPGAASEFLKIEVVGLQGGHSGVDIHEPRANANKLVARLLSAVSQVTEVRLCSWMGGTKHNAIPRESVATIAVPAAKFTEVKRTLDVESESIMAYYRSELPNARILEPNIVVKWAKSSSSPCYSPDESAKIIRTLNALPHGYRNFSPEVPGLVEVSSNVAIMKTEKDTVSVLVSARGNIDAELEAFRRTIADIGRMGGWSVQLGSAYPGWKPQPGSPFLQFVKKHYKEALGTEVKIEAIHAGLECGIIGARIPGIQIVSIGPTVKGAHTPDERVKVQDVGIIYTLLRNILRTLPELRM